MRWADNADSRTPKLTFGTESMCAPRIRMQQWSLRVICRWYKTKSKHLPTSGVQCLNCNYLCESISGIQSNMLVHEWLRYLSSPGETNKKIFELKKLIIRAIPIKTRVLIYYSVILFLLSIMIRYYRNTFINYNCIFWQ